MIAPMDITIGVCGFVRSIYSQQQLGSTEIRIYIMNIDGTTIGVPIKTTDSNDYGFYAAGLPNGTYKMVATKDKYSPIEYAVHIDGNIVIQDILLAFTGKKRNIEDDNEKGINDKKLLFCEIFDLPE